MWPPSHPSSARRSGLRWILRWSSRPWGEEYAVMADSADNPKRQFTAAWNAAAAAMDEGASRWRRPPLKRWTSSIQPSVPAWEAARAAVAGTWGACQCPCVTAHPQDQGVCDGRAILTRRLGEANMPTCAPCAVAQGVAEMRH